MSNRVLGEAILGAGWMVSYARVFANPRRHLVTAASVLDGVPRLPAFDGAEEMAEAMFASAISASQGDSERLPLDVGAAA